MMSIGFRWASPATHQQLCTIGNDALCEAGERVKQGCTFAVVHAETVANLLGNTTYCNDGYRVVSRADIGQRD